MNTCKESAASSTVNIDEEDTSIKEQNSSAKRQSQGCQGAGKFGEELKLKSHHVPARARVTFSQEQSGKARVKMTVNQELKDMWVQWWLSHGKENILTYKVCGDTVKLKVKEIKDGSSTVILGMKMTGSNKYTTVSFKTISNTEVILEGKKSKIDSKTYVGNLLRLLLFFPIHNLSEENLITSETDKKEGKKPCRGCCREETPDILSCRFCGQQIHVECKDRDEDTCKDLCGDLEVRTKAERKLLEYNLLQPSEFYRLFVETIKKLVTTTTKEDVVEEAAAAVTNMSETNPKPDPKPIRPAVTTAIQPLKVISNDNVGRLETKCLIGGDERYRGMVGKKIEIESEPEKEKEKEKALTAKEILDKQEEKREIEVKLSDEIVMTLRNKLRKTVCNDHNKSEGSWLRSVLIALTDQTDLDYLNTEQGLSVTLREEIPKLRDKDHWVMTIFGGDAARMQSFIKKEVNKDMTPNIMTGAGRMLCLATAQVLKRTIKLYTIQEEDMDVTSTTFSGGIEAQSKPEFNILLHDGRFWGLLSLSHDDDELDEVTGMRGPSQSAAGRNKRHRQKGPTLAPKSKKPATKASRDELRRRDERAKTEQEVKIDALQTLCDSLKADNGDLLDKLRNLEDRNKTQLKYIHSIERRFSDLCTRCKQKTPPTAFTREESFMLQRMAHILEEQSAKLEELTRRGAQQTPTNTNVPSKEETSPGSGTQEDEFL